MKRYYVDVEIEKPFNVFGKERYLIFANSIDDAKEKVKQHMRDTMTFGRITDAFLKPKK